MMHAVIALGASTGGTKALATVLSQLPAQLAQHQVTSAPIVVVTQHIDPGFAQALAESLNKATEWQVALATDNQALQPGHVYLAPGDRHLVVDCHGGTYRSRLDNDPPRDNCKPSVAVMFESLAMAEPQQTVAVLLTGMGKDGAKELLTLRQQGAHTLVQDEATSVVWGMPGEAVRLNAAQQVVALDDMAAKIASVLASEED